MLIKFLNSAAFYFCMDEASGDGAAGGGAAGAPAKTTADTNSNASASATVSTTVGEAAKAGGEQSSAAATTQSIGTQDTNNANAGDFRAGWPDELKNDPSLKDFKDTQTLAKALVDTKKLVGQKLGIPGADATPEAKAAFYEALGVPKEAAGYEFKPPENLPEFLKENYDQANADKWAGLFQKHNVPKEAANALRNELFAEITSEIGEINTAAATSDEEFGKMAREVYGDDKKATEAMQKANTIIEKHLPPSLKGALQNIPNAALLAMAKALGEETKALTGEDNVIGRDNGTSNAGKSSSELRAEAKELMKDPSYNSPFAKGKDAHEAIKKKVQDLYKAADAASQVK